MTPVVTWLAKFSGYLQISAVVALVTGIVVAVIAGLILMIRYTRPVGVLLRALGIVFLVCGAALVYGRFRLPAVHMSRTWPWIPIIGAVLLAAEWILRRQRIKGVNNRVSGIAADCAEYIDVLSQKYKAADFADLTVDDGNYAIYDLTYFLRRPRKFSHIFLVGSPGSGKTATLLNFAADCQAFQSSRKRPLIPIYVDLAEYARQVGDGTLTEFLQAKYSGLNPSKTWTQNGRDVRWLFLFDNADEADLYWLGRRESWSIVSSFMRQRSRTATFFVVFASRRPPRDADPGSCITLAGLAEDAWKSFLVRSGLTQPAVDALAKNESLRSYLENPGGLRLLAPVLAGRGWKTGDDVVSALDSDDNAYRLMADAIDRLIRTTPHIPPTEAQSLYSTAVAVMEFLQDQRAFFPSFACGINDGRARIAECSGSSVSQLDENLAALARRGIIKRTSGQDGVDFVEFSPPIGAYFYAYFLLRNHPKIPVRKMLSEEEFRLTALTLLDVAPPEVVEEFIRDSADLLDHAIDGLGRESETSNVPSDPARLQKIAYPPYLALSVLVYARQNKFDELRDQLQEKVGRFTELAMPLFAGSAAVPGIIITQADLLDLSRTLGAREEAISTLKFGLDSPEPSIIFETSGRLVNAISENDLAELDQTHRDKLLFIVMFIGLRSLSTGRGRATIPPVLRFADNVGAITPVLFGVLFGLGGIFQLINFRHFDYLGSNYPLPQVCELIFTTAVTLPIAAARYRTDLRRFLLRPYSAVIMQGIGGSLAIAGAFWLLAVLVSDLATFSVSLMPVIASYSLLWPGAVMLHLYSDRRPTILSVIFPLPQDARTLWHAFWENL